MIYLTVALIAILIILLFFYLNHKNWIRPELSFLCLLLFLVMIGYNKFKGGVITAEFVGLSFIILGIAGNQALKQYKSRQLPQESVE